MKNIDNTLTAEEIEAYEQEMRKAEAAWARQMAIRYFEKDTAEYEKDR